MTPARDLDARYRMRIEAGEASVGTTTRERADVTVAASDVLSRLPWALKSFPKDEDGETKEDAPRKADFFLPEPYTYEIRWRAVPPPGFTPLPLPEAPAIDLGPAARLTRTLAVAEGGTLTATFRFEALRRRISPADYAALRRGLRAFLEESRLVLSFEHAGRAHLAAGRVKEALREMRRLAALHPTEALHRIDVADALLAAGLGEAAREEARRATELEPRSAAAFRKLAWTLQHDLIGRRFKPGWDRAGAIAAYRKMKELDPKSYGRFDLAILLEHDGRGRRYAPGADLVEAAQELKATRGELKDKRMGDDVALDLLFARRFQEAHAFAKDLPQSRTRDLVEVIATAATAGTRAALAELRKLMPDPAARRDGLTGAARDLISLRMYPEAATLVAEAARGAPNAAQLEAWLAQIRRVRRFEELDLPEDDPTSVVKRFLLAIMTFEGDDPRELAGYFSEASRPEIVTEEGARDFARGVRAAQAPAAAQGMPLRVMAEAGLGGLTFTSEGEPAMGFRVRMRGSSATGTVQETYFVVREDGAFRIVTSLRTPGGLGVEALRRAGAGDLAGARRWLDWAREAVPALGADEPLLGSPFPAFWRE
ncbi:MAG TPA: hypothetical protein VHF22_00875, partial [Planctomycetota bacterium]|nr:hypothetical protein [Planctomycetota bacterium]